MSRFLTKFPCVYCIKCLLIIQSNKSNICQFFKFLYTRKLRRSFVNQSIENVWPTLPSKRMKYTESPSTDSNIQVEFHVTSSKKEDKTPVAEIQETANNNPNEVSSEEAKVFIIICFKCLKWYFRATEV